MSINLRSSVRTLHVILARFAVVVGCLTGIAGWSTPAAALACQATVAAPIFGAVNLLPGGATSALGSLSVSCTGAANEKNINVVACPSINAGTGNAGAAGPQRFLKSGNAQIAFNLYQDAYTTVWGDINMAGAAPPRLVISLDASGAGVANVALYARIAGGQGNAATGNYASDFLVTVRSTTSTSLSCASVITNPAAPTAFSVNASYASNCLIQTSNLDFGTIGSLNAVIDAETMLAVTCSTGSTYTVGLDGGTANAVDPTARRLSKSGNTDVIYGLYRDASRAQPWGTSIGSVNGGAGNGTAQTYTVFGRIPKQPFPATGLYQDTIVVTVGY